MRKRMAADEQLNLDEHLPFKGIKLECKKQFFNGSILLFDGHWKDKENENHGAEYQHVKSTAPGLKKEVAIRRIKNENCFDGWKDVADKLVDLNHNNILRVFGYEEDVASGWRYFALEPYSATLYEFCNGKYEGAMPNESQVLCQITNGICHLHSEGIVHGDLNPLNVVIAAQSRPVRMKISDFGLSKFSYGKKLSEGKKNIDDYDWEVELCQRKYWTLSEKSDSLEGIEDATEDVIAAGCILFYYLTRGKHLFGDDSESILNNLKEKNPVNVEVLSKYPFAYEPIKNMIIPPRRGFSWLQIANKKFNAALSLQVNNSSKRLGNGTFGDVYEGKFNGDLVAVKQIKTTTAQKEIIQREMCTHIELDHVNVVKLLDVVDSADNTFTQLALELCAGTLADYCENKYNGPALPPDELVLYQIAIGLDYIHSRNLVHRDVKPDNILISITTPIQIKVSDLSFVKKTREDIFSQSKIRGTLLWMAPEGLKFLGDPNNMPDDLPDGTIKSDTFSLGCLFFYFLTRGVHPFGNSATAPANILKNKPAELANYKQNDVNRRILAGLIESMIKFKEKERIGLPEVIKELAILLYQKKEKIQCRLRHVDMAGSIMYAVCSHPTEPIFACISNHELIFYTAENSSIPFSNWKKKVICLPEIIHWGKVESLKWNINGTQIAVGSVDYCLIVWNYPECHVLFEKQLKVTGILWNPTKPNLLATFGRRSNRVFVSDSSTGNVITTIDSEKVKAVKWISENRIAVSSLNGRIRIFEVDENNLTTTRFVKEFRHGSECDHLEWNERTQYLANGGGDRINIWSLDRDEPIYNLLIDGEIAAFAFRPPIGNGEEEDGIEMARKSTKNFNFVYASHYNGVFLWNPLENEQKPRRLSDECVDFHYTFAFSSDGGFLAAGSLDKLIIWSAEDWEQIYVWGIHAIGYDCSWLSTTNSTNVNEDKFMVNLWNRPSTVLEFALEESKISDLANQNIEESNGNDEDFDSDDVIQNA
ncbi:uncharacterized protein LOC130692782 [Daphnia carinata]|uniref:uncharacterized protein LOC130692782 n=1 Tax=Daphnia carinata TaxID=120202 RepID=UPI00257C5A6D|nr:uncharacterized protein LOC130692782 [Daphnia carinata]XP_057371834.1 uncharacterized protein LOC130692782 [Daphnia carinata]